MNFCPIPRTGHPNSETTRQLARPFLGEKKGKFIASDWRFSVVSHYYHTECGPLFDPAQTVFPINGRQSKIWVGTGPESFFAFLNGFSSTLSFMILALILLKSYSNHIYTLNPQDSMWAKFSYENIRNRRQYPSAAETCLPLFCGFQWVLAIATSVICKLQLQVV